MAYLPNLIIIGAAKAGTTSLQRYLSLHPEIYMSKVKELNFFAYEGDRTRSIDWYKSNFPEPRPILGEASPVYARYPRVKGIPEKMRATLGKPKLIYMLRDPIERILSHYVEAVDGGWETVDFSTRFNRLLEAGEQYVQCSMYYMQLEQYLNVFPPENILVVFSERLKANGQDTLKEIFRFLNVDENFWTPEFAERLNTASKKKRPAKWFNSIAPKWLRQEMLQPKRIPWKINRLLRQISLVGSSASEKPLLDADQDRKLQEMLMDDVRRLREWLGDPIPEWRAYS